MIAGALLACLVLLLPFELRRPTLDVFGLHFTLLELATAAITLALVVISWRAVLAVWRTRPLPLVAISAYAAAHAVSAALTPYHRSLAAHFALRMTAMAVFATVVAALPAEARRRGLAALPWAALGVALLAIAEGVGLRGLDPLLDLFREGPVYVNGVRRATAGSEHPNLAGAFLMYGMVAGAAWRPRARWGLVGAALVALGHAATYSRGAALSAGIGLLVAAVAARERRAWSSLIVLVAVLAVSAALRGGWRPAPALGARYEPADPVLAVASGESRAVVVRVTNTGSDAWAEGEVSLSYHLLRRGALAVEDGPRTRLSALSPGASVPVKASLVAPRETGTWWLVWDTVRGPRTWLSAQGSVPATVTLLVGGAPRESGAPPAPIAWNPSRRELWSLALRLWRERPLLGVGPDNFRRLYGRAAGRAFWDERIYANNTLLEAAATTGIFGAVALAAALALTAWRASRSRSAEAPTVLALLAGTIAHGLVDYVLAMTGHYLTFALLVGSAAALDE